LLTSFSFFVVCDVIIYYVIYLILLLMLVNRFKLSWERFYNTLGLVVRAILMYRKYVFYMLLVGVNRKCVFISVTALTGTSGPVRNAQFINGILF
jgi:hypothetical protein